MAVNSRVYKMQINPLDTIREETTLLKLFQSIMSESEYTDTIVKDIFEQQNEIRQIIYRKNDNYAYLKLDDFNNLLEELNEKIKLRNLKCSIENISCKDLSKMVEYLRLEPAFICRRCKSSKIFDSEDELRTHREECDHRIISWMSQRDKQLTIIKNNATCISVSLFDLIDKSGILAEINNRLKPINLKCDLIKEKTVEESNVNDLEFEPAFMCRQCSNMIFDTEKELKEHGKRHEMERKKYSDSGKTSKSDIKRQREHEEWLKSRDRTR